MENRKISILHYRFVQVLSWIVSTFLFRRRIRRNELHGVKGPFVVIANHEAALDFVNLIGLSKRPMRFVISRSFFCTLPVQKYLTKIGLIPKQQFQTTMTDMKRCRAAVEAGEPLVIYPAGLMSEDGLSTPIPAGSYKFLKWLDTDVYAARTDGAYFVMPKWSGKFRPGRTEMDVYKLFSKEELRTLSVEEIRKRAEHVLLFDAYKKQEELRYLYRGGSDIRGLENVLYVCPKCGESFTMEARGKHRLECTACGYGVTCDPCGFFHTLGGGEPVFRRASDWSAWIQQTLQEKLERGEAPDELTQAVEIRLIDEGKHKFRKAGLGQLTLTRDGFFIRGMLEKKPLEVRIPISGTPTLPFKPGKYLEIQDGLTIYRCLPQDGRQVIKFIHMVKIFYQQKAEARK